MVSKKDRLYLNIVKGVAIFLMLWGHCIQYTAKGSFSIWDDAVFKTIYSFHMPLFMLISGYLFFFSFEKRDLKTLLVHRSQGMLQPIVFASMLNALLIQLPTAILHGTFQIFDGGLFNSLYSLWFLWCVLSSSTAVAVACKTGRNLGTRLVYLTLGIFFVALFPDNRYHLYMYPYFILGFFWGMYRRKLPGWFRKLGYLAIPLFFWMLGSYEMKHFIYSTPVYTADIDARELVRLNGFRWAIGLVGSVFVLMTVRLILEHFIRKRRIPQILKLLGKLGEQSLAVYCLSVSLLSYYLSKICDRLVAAAGFNPLTEIIPLYHLLIVPAITGIYCFVLYGAVLLTKKCRIYSLIFGK